MENNEKQIIQGLSFLYCIFYTASSYTTSPYTLSWISQGPGCLESSGKLVAFISTYPVTCPTSCCQVVAKKLLIYRHNAYGVVKHLHESYDMYRILKTTWINI